MKLNRWIIWGASGVVVLALIGYFAVMPMLQVSSYKKAAEPKQQQLQDKMQRVYDSFKRDVFTKSDTETASDKADIQIGFDAVKDAQTALDLDTAVLTQFSSRPLLDWNSNYKAAGELDAQEATYASKSRSFLTDYKALLTYADKINELGTEFTNATKELEAMGDNETPAALADKIDAAAATLQTTADKVKAVTPPTYLKDNHESAVKAVDGMITVLKELSAATRKLDITKITALSNDMTKQETAAAHLDQDLVTKLQSDSPIRNQINELRDLNDGIVRGYAKL
jgi:septation ring formation regulator EzrA